MSSTRSLLLAFCATFCAGLPAVAFQTPAQDGAWEEPFPLPLIAIHSSLLHTGEVLLFSAEHGVPGIHGWLLDPESLALVEAAPPSGWNPDCAGHSFLADGRLLVTGGTLSFGPLTGSREAYLFDPYSEQWVPLADMARGRWYPTNVTLADGTVLTLSGLSDSAAVPNPDIELWDPEGAGDWQLLGVRTLPFYPLLHLLSNGLVFMAGPEALTETYDPATDTWVPVATTNFAGRYEATSVLLPPAMDRVMLIGGFTGSGPPTSSAEIIDLSAPAPIWTGTAHMAFRRMEHDAVLLPDGKVLVVGGRSDNDASPSPVLVPEIFDPATETWDAVAEHAVPRMYHSTAILLPDGRVLAAGGDNHASGEIYSPPYLFRGPRPVITSAPTAVTYGAAFDIGFTSSTADNTAVLIRLSCVTHSNNMSQRYVALGGIGAPGGGVSVPAPSAPTAAPPGFYMLFVVDDTGVPSIARMIRVDSEPGTPFCFGVRCPCGNDDPAPPNGGCANSTGVGARLTASGSTSVAADDLVLTTSGCPPSNTGLYFMGSSALTPVFVGDGLGCTGGLFRFFPSVVTPAGSFTLTGPVAAAPPGFIAAGDTRHFQSWTRDVLCGPPPSPCPTPCGMNSNLSNGLTVTFRP